MLSEIGGAYSGFGDTEKAIEFQVRALQLYRASNERSFEAMVLGRLGSLYAERGEKQQAIDSYSQALDLQRAWSSPLKDRTGQTAVESESAHGKEA